MPTVFYVSGALNGTINNSGTISASVTEGGKGVAYSIYAPTAGGKGTLNNLAGGQLIGNLNTGTGVAVNNAGTISIPSAGVGTSGNRRRLHAASRRLADPRRKGCWKLQLADGRRNGQLHGQPDRGYSCDAR